MIVVLLGGSEFDRKAAEMLKPQAILSDMDMVNGKLKGLTDTDLVLVDLSANGEFQKGFVGGGYANTLIKYGLPKNFKRLTLLVSNVNLDHRLPTLAENISERFQMAKRDVSVCTVGGDLNYASAFVVPDVNQNKWTVYGIEYSDDVRKLQSSFPDSSIKDAMSVNHLPDYEKCAQKQKLFEGDSESLFKYLQETECHVTAEAARLKNGGDASASGGGKCVVS